MERAICSWGLFLLVSLAAPGAVVAGQQIDYTKAIAGMGSCENLHGTRPWHTRLIVSANAALFVAPGELPKDLVILPPGRIVSVIGGEGEFYLIEVVLADKPVRAYLHCAQAYPSPGFTGVDPRRSLLAAAPAPTTPPSVVTRQRNAPPQPAGARASGATTAASSTSPVAAVEKQAGGKKTKWQLFGEALVRGADAWAQAQQRESAAAQKQAAAALDVPRLPQLQTRHPVPASSSSSSPWAFYSDNRGVSGTANRIGGTTFYNYSDGTTGTSNRIGNTTFFDFQNRAESLSGTSMSIGNTDFHSLSNGVSGTSNRIGGMTFSSFSDGTNCTANVIGTMTFTDCR